MNRYAAWKYAILVIAVLLGMTYVLPNFFGEVDAVQISPGKSTVKLDPATRTRVEQAFAGGGDVRGGEGLLGDHQVEQEAVPQHGQELLRRGRGEAHIQVGAALVVGHLESSPTPTWAGR